MAEPAPERTPPDIGDRVILAAARGRSRAALGTVIARDPHPDRNAIVQVLHEDGVPRWRRRDALRTLEGHRMSPDDLAADLTSMGLAHLITGVETDG